MTRKNILSKPQEVKMLTKKTVVMFSVLLLVGIVTGSLTGCTTFSSIGGTADAHGLFGGAKPLVNEANEIASYSVILGLVDSGYNAYIDAVKQAEASGKVVTSVTKWYYVFTKTTAYAGN
jgi:hypothetical protein